MRSYSWAYGIFHWLMHYLLAVIFLRFSGVVIIEGQEPFNLFGFYLNDGILDYIIIGITSSLIDLDHTQTLKKFGFKKYIWAQKRVVSPLHNFFVLSVFAAASAFSAIFFSKPLAVMLFSVVLHIIWDIIEDVFIFRTSFRRWEKTWGLNTKDLEDAYNELMLSESSRSEETVSKEKAEPEKS